MDKKTENSVLELKKAIDGDALIQEYNRLAKEIADSTEVKDLEDKLKDLQQQLVKTLDANMQELHDQVKEQYLELKGLYENHPLVSNYLSLKEEAANLLHEIEEILNSI